MAQKKTTNDFVITPIDLEEIIKIAKLSREVRDIQTTKEVKQLRGYLNRQRRIITIRPLRRNTYPPRFEF